MSITRIKSGKRMSQAVVRNGTVFTAGQVATGESVTEQTKAILSQIDALLEEAGTSKSNLLTAMIWISDISYFEEMNTVWDAWVDADNAPARACVEAKLAREELYVEIQVSAAID